MNSFELLEVIIDAGKQPYVQPVIRELQDYHLPTYLHSIHVAMVSAQIALEYGLNITRIKYIAEGALIHDAGKLDVPLSILNKPGKLTAEELEEIRKHPVNSYKRAKEMNAPLIPSLICLMHHYYLNGSGYPSSFPDEIDHSRIPTEARIVTTSDIFCAIVSPRSYKDSLENIYAIGEIYQGLARGKLDARFAKILDTLVQENRLLLNVGSFAERRVTSKIIKKV